MESCLVISKTKKEDHKKGKVIFINAHDLVKKEKNISFLEPEHIETIYNVYIGYVGVDGLSRVVDSHEIIQNRSSLNISLYVNKYSGGDSHTFNDVYRCWESSANKLSGSMDALFKRLGG